MKIGIVTFHRSDNYGAFLQAYALQRTIEIQTKQFCEIIDIFLTKTEKRKYDDSVRVYQPIDRLFSKRKYHMFSASRKEFLKVSEEPVCGDDVAAACKLIEEKYDLIVVGSDEVWKMNSYRGFPNIYWITEVKKAIKMGYAISSRTPIDSLTAEQKTEIENIVRSFQYISVRDIPTKKMIEHCTGGVSKVQVVCDPTFLYDFGGDKVRDRRFVEEKYGTNPNKKTIALMVADKGIAQRFVKEYSKNYNIIALYNYHPGTKGIFVPNPFEWIHVINGVDALITSYFHGAVFAIKNHVPIFGIESRTGVSNEYSKLYNLLRSLDCEEFFVSSAKPQDLIDAKIKQFVKFYCVDGHKIDNREYCEQQKRTAEPFLNKIKQLARCVPISDTACVGCGACAEICPQRAIQMSDSPEGFAIPVVDKEKCTTCGKCLKVCVGLGEVGNEAKIRENTYAVKYNNDEIVTQSRSGGAFYALAEIVLSGGGAVYGAALMDGALVKHIRVESLEELSHLQKSKYVQSTLSGVYESLKNDLLVGRTVLFSGTPCQVAAIKNCVVEMGLNTSKLITVDILCHGVPSPKIFRDYIHFLEGKYHCIVKDFQFRNKELFGWGDHAETFMTKKGVCVSRDYAKLFYRHDILRKCCFYCGFKSEKRIGDITIGDFWGIERISAAFADNKGVSLVMTNTNKGENLFEEAKARCIFLECNIKDNIPNSMKFAYPEPMSRNAFWEKYKYYGITGAIFDYKKDVIKKKINKKIRNMKIHLHLKSNDE